VIYIAYGDPYISLKEDYDKDTICYDIKLFDNDVVVEVEDMFLVRRRWRKTDEADC